MRKEDHFGRQMGMFGRLLRDIRQARGIAPEELARGICTVKALEKYESGEREPEKLTADALFTRLRKSMDKFEIILGYPEYNMAVCRMQIQRLLRVGKLLEAEEGIDRYVGMDGALHLHYQYACFLRAELLRKRQVPMAEQIANVVDGIYQTLETRNKKGIRKVTAEEKTGRGLQPKCLSERYSSKMELYLLERYAILLEADGRQAEAVLWYRAIIQYLDDEEYDLADRYSLYPVMAYQLAKYYGEQRRKEEAFWYIARGCEMLGRRKNQLALFCRLTELKFLLEDAREGEVKPDHREREEYRSLCGSKTLKEAGFLDNWYPMYREKHLICFNDLVRERRLAAGMSKTELAYGIFAERTLERMEARKNTPRALAREKLLQKLKLPMEKYNAGIVTVRYQDYRKVGRLEMLCQEGKYREAREIYRELQRCIDLKNLTNQQWAEYWDIRIADGLGHLSPGMKGERLWALLQKTVPIKRGCPQFECQLMRNERYVLNQIANGIVPEKTKMKKILLNQIKIFYQKREKKLFDPEYLIQMFVQLGNAVREEKNYPLALRYLHMAQKKMEELDEWHFWEYILLYEQCVVQEAGTWKSDFQCARQAYAISRLYAKNQVICDYIIRWYGESI